MPSIEIDDEVFAHLQEQAIPLVDDPNQVLRRLLFPSGKNRAAKRPALDLTSTSDFVGEIRDGFFGGGLRRIRPYTYLFESSTALVYFQNFNQADSDSLWYRLRSSALHILLASPEKGAVCLTNPADRIFYVLPVAAIERRRKSSGWERDDLEVNIDHKNRLWRELDWDISQYLHQL